MNSIFKNAYFGKPYKTRDERRALYWRYVIRNGEFIHYLILPNESGAPMSTEDEIIANKEGKNLNTSYTELSSDIVSEWQEEVSEDELDKLAIKLIYETIDDFQDGEKVTFNLLKDLVKAGLTYSHS